ncbi:MAG: hypothetical protein OEZ43_02405 [Gammaproteobacteria bacterium]|nr:hypothetical protein [Gammaproteobacteria bacterium]
MKLVQKRFLKGSKEFEIVDDILYVQVKGILKSEKLALNTALLNSEGVENGDELDFYDSGRNRVVFSMYRNEPSQESFSRFIELLKYKIDGVELDIESDPGPEAPGWNVYEEPPEFDDVEDQIDSVQFRPVSANRVANDIVMLKTYLDEESIKPFLESLEALKENPENEIAFQHMLEAYHNSGAYQGAILTYAPYLKVILSYSAFEV